ncbi:MAG: VOC family protein [Actinomycetes bacterium]
MPIRTDPWPAGTPCWLDISVPDPAAAQEFYGAVAGWEFENQGEEYANYVLARRNGADAAGMGPQQSPDQPVGWMMYLASDDADATAKAVVDNGGQVVMEPMEMPGLGKMFIAVDPQGAGFGVWQAQGQIGIGIYNEPGGLVWEQLIVPDAAAAQRFYGALFPTLEFTAQGDSVMFRRPGLDENIGGISSVSDQPPGWLCYLAVDDAVKAEAIVLERGGSSVQKVTPTEWGNLGVVADPWGAAIGLGDSQTTS